MDNDVTDDFFANWEERFETPREAMEAKWKSKAERQKPVRKMFKKLYQYIAGNKMIQLLLKSSKQTILLLQASMISMKRLT